jgi:hypothetical protein
VGVGSRIPAAQLARAALPPHSAERLCLSADAVFFLLRLRLRAGGIASQNLKQARTESHRLSALCGGKAAPVIKLVGYLSQKENRNSNREHLYGIICSSKDEEDLF